MKIFDFQVLVYHWWMNLKTSKMYQSIYFSLSVHYARIWSRNATASDPPPLKIQNSSKDFLCIALPRMLHKLREKNLFVQVEREESFCKRSRGGLFRLFALPKRTPRSAFWHAGHRQLDRWSSRLKSRLWTISFQTCRDWRKWSRFFNAHSIKCFQF